MDDLARFAPCNFRGGARLKNGSQGCVDPTWRGHRAIIPTQQVCFFAFGYLAAFSNASAAQN